MTDHSNPVSLTLATHIIDVDFSYSFLDCLLDPVIVCCAAHMENVPKETL